MGLNYRKDEKGNILELEKSDIKEGDLVVYLRKKLCTVSKVTFLCDIRGKDPSKILCTAYDLIDHETKAAFEFKVPFYRIQKVEEYK